MLAFKKGGVKAAVWLMLETFWTWIELFSACPIESMEGRTYPPLGFPIAANVIRVWVAKEKSTYPIEYDVFLIVAASSSGPSALTPFFGQWIPSEMYFSSIVKLLLLLFSWTTIILSDGRFKSLFRLFMAGSFHLVIVPLNIEDKTLAFSFMPTGISGKLGTL